MQQTCLRLICGACNAKVYISKTTGRIEKCFWQSEWRHGVCESTCSVLIWRTFCCAEESFVQSFLHTRKAFDKKLVHLEVHDRKIINKAKAFVVRVKGASVNKQCGCVDSENLWVFSWYRSVCVCFWVSVNCRKCMKLCYVGRVLVRSSHTKCACFSCSVQCCQNQTQKFLQVKFDQALNRLWEAVKIFSPDNSVHTVQTSVQIQIVSTCFVIFTS